MSALTAGGVVRNLLAHAAKKTTRGLAFPKGRQAELLAATDRLIANTRAAADLFVTEGARAAQLLTAEKSEFRDIKARATQAHFEQPRSGRTETAETSALHLDIPRDLKRVNTHLVAAAAFPVLEGKGELLPSRLRKARAVGKR